MHPAGQEDAAAEPGLPVLAQPDSPTDAVVSQQLKASTLAGVKWNFLATAATLLGRLVFTFALARILGPESFGIVSVATIYIAFVVVVLDQGYGVALVQKERIEDTDIGTVAWMNLGTSAALTVLTFVASPAVAAFFDTPELDGVLKALAVTLLLRGLLLVPLALARRALRFKEQALAQSVAVIVGGVAGIVAALAGADFWALVVQTIVTDVIVVTWLVIVVGRTSWQASMASLRSMLGFSTHLLLSSLLVFLGANADNLLVARFEGTTQLAFYALAFRLLRLPIQMSASVVTGVALPVLSRLQGDDERTRSWFLVATQALALLTFPMFALLAVGAEDGVLAVFGPEWEPATTPVQAMALAGAPMVARMLLAPLATARAHTGNVLLWSVVVVGLQVVGFVIGLWLGGMVGVALALLVVQYVTWFPQVAFTLTPILGLRLRDYLRVLIAPFVGSLVAAAVWWLVETSQQRAYDGPLVLQLVLSTVVALAAYLAVVRLVWPQVFSSTASLLGQMARRQASA